jgi:hypothetical protein
MMTHETYVRHEVSDKVSNRTFGLLFSALFCLAGILPLFSGGIVRIWSVVAGCMFLIVTLLRPSLLTLLSRAWMKFGSLLHRIMSPVILSVIFFLVVTPYSLVLRAFRKELLSLSFDPAAVTYWQSRSPGQSAGSHFTKQF